MLYPFNKFENWLGFEVQKFFNLKANIIALNEEREMNSALPSFSQNNLTEFTETFRICCWYCSKEHRMLSCQIIICLKLEDKKNFVKKKRIFLEMRCKRI